VTKSFELVKSKIAENGDALFHCYLKVPRHIVKKNRRNIFRNRQTGRMFPGKSNDLISAEARLINAFRTQIMRDRQFATIDRPIWCVFLFYFPASDFSVKKGPRKGKMSGRMPDLSNLLELPADALQDAGVIENDRLICSFDLSRRLPGDTCALEIFVFEYELDQAARLRAVP
jgi:Holliday junction resolvase RusA-like endonuclease